jgi:hypothetical protein
VFKPESNRSVSGGVTAAPKGATVYARVVEAVKAKRIRGRAKLVIELTDVMLNDVLHPVVIDQLGYEGGRSGVLKKIVAGATIVGSPPRSTPERGEESPF